MKLGTKLIIAGSLAGIAVTTTALLVQRSVLVDQSIDLTKSAMRSALVQAEETRHMYSALTNAGAFDHEKLVREAKASSDLRTTNLFNTIPMIAAGQSIKTVAEMEGFEQRFTRFQARNPRNEPTEAEARILRELEQTGAEEYFEVDKSTHQIVYVRPIRLTTDCLSCHGNPANSPTGDGKDMLGFKMEGWKEGELRGAFILRSSMDKVDKVVVASLFTALNWIVPLALVVSLGFAAFIRFAIVRPLDRAAATIEDASGKTAAAAAEITCASQAIAGGATEQAAALEQTGASIEELSSIVRSNADSAQGVRQHTIETRQVTEAGASAVARVVAQIDATAATSREMTSAMEQIREASTAISRILKTIDEIAFQTNILALNAAVEAARAGEAGLGFAVVADEVRNLARRSAEAARETAALIEDCVARSQSGFEINRRVSENLATVIQGAQAIAQQFGAITGKVKEVDTLVEEIATASTQQHEGMVQISQAVTQMDKVTQSNAASAEETASAAETLKAQAADLNRAVDSLRLILEGAVRPTAAELATPAAAALAAARPQAETAAALTAPARALPAPRHSRPAGASKSG